MAAELASAAEMVTTPLMVASQAGLVEVERVGRSRVYRLLRRGEVRVNGKRKQADYRLAADDEVRRFGPVGAGIGHASTENSWIV